MKRMSFLYRSTLRNVMALGLSVVFVVAVSGCSQKCGSTCPQQKMAGSSSKCASGCSKKACCAKKCAAGCTKACCAKDAKTASSSAVNTKCPFSGQPVLAAVTTTYGDKTVGFCCGGCVGKWEKLSGDEKAKKLASAM